MKHSSTRPKGATSYKDTAFGVILRSRLLVLELEGTKRGLDYLHDLFKQEKRISITPDFICTLHNIAFGWIFPGWAGKYRKIQVSFSGKESLPYYQIPELIVNLCRDLSVRLGELPKSEHKEYIFSVVTLLAWFQHRFVFIHPFQDYNGRIARMITLAILLDLHLPPIEIKVETSDDRKKYIMAMQEADLGRMNFLEVMISQALTESLKIGGKK